MSAIDSTMFLAQVQPPPPIANVEIHSALDFVIKGGWAIAPIIVCSIFALTLVVERLISLRRRRVIPPRFVAALKSVNGDSSNELELCRADDSPIAHILAVAIRHRNDSIELREKRVEEAGQREVVDLRKHMRVLSALPQVSTMLGLLGTIFGMIKTFQAIASTGEALGKTEMLAKGIYEAWTATAAGLLVAIPTLVAFHFLQGRIDSMIAAIDRAVVDWLDVDNARRSEHSTGAVEFNSVSKPAPAAARV